MVLKRPPNPHFAPFLHQNTWLLVNFLDVYNASLHSSLHSAIEARRVLLSACADAENEPAVGAYLSSQNTESYRSELKDTKKLIKRLRRLRERGLI